MHSYAKADLANVQKEFGLNPCFNGRCTRTTKKVHLKISLKVLILVLMEDALVPLENIFKSFNENCLNPCFNGRCTRTSMSQ